jgi:hypothetical protein
MSKVVLKFKEEVSANGNVSKVANIKGELLKLSDPTFEYANRDGEVLQYKLATIKFADHAGTNHVRENVVVYSTSYNKGMEVGTTYLGKVSRSNNADGTPRKPWVTLSSLVSGVDFADDDFEEVVVEEPELSIQ